VAPDEIGVLQLRARLERQRGNLDGAETLARTAAEREPHHAAVWIELAAVLRQRMEKAQSDAKAATRAGKSEDAARFTAAAARFQVDAANALRQALLREPRQFHAQTELAHLELASMPPSTATNDAYRAHLMKGAEKALELLDRSLELIPKSPKAYNNRAIALLRMGIGSAQLGRAAEAQERLAAALESSENALEIEPKRVKSWSNKAYVLWAMDNLTAAHEAALKTRELDPGYAFDSRFVAKLAAAGTPLPPPSTTE